MPISDTDPGGLGVALSGVLTALAAVVVAIGHAIGLDQNVITTVAALVIAAGNVGIIWFVRSRSWPPQAVRQLLTDQGGTIPPSLAIPPVDKPVDPPVEENG